MKFTFKTSVAPSSLSRAVIKIRDYCESLKDGDLVDTRGLTDACGWINNGTTANHSAHPALTAYRHLMQGKLWWGNKRTIAQFKAKYD